MNDNKKIRITYHVYNKKDDAWYYLDYEPETGIWYPEDPDGVSSLFQRLKRSQSETLEENPEVSEILPIDTNPLENKDPDESNIEVTGIYHTQINELPVTFEIDLIPAVFGLKWFYNNVFLKNPFLGTIGFIAIGTSIFIIQDPHTIKLLWYGLKKLLGSKPEDPITDDDDLPPLPPLPPLPKKK